MEARYLTWNFANFITINLMVITGGALVMLAMRWRNRNKGTAVGS